MNLQLETICKKTLQHQHRLLARGAMWNRRDDIEPSGIQPANGPLKPIGVSE